MVTSKKLFNLLTVLFLLLSTNFSAIQAQLVVSSETDPAVLIENFLGAGVVVSNVEYDCPEGAGGLFEGSNTNIGIDSGIMLTTGHVDNAVGPNIYPNLSSMNGGGGDADLEEIIGLGQNTNDACSIEFDFMPLASTLTFNYVFGSEEYLEYVDLFNDVFAFFISGPGFTGSENIALLPGTNTPVTINNINDEDNSDFFVNNGDGIDIDSSSTVQYDGFTTVLSVTVTVDPCETYHLKLVVADALDSQLDSGVFLEAKSLATDVAFGEPIQNCNPDGSFNLDISFDGEEDGSNYSITETNTALGIDDFTFVDDGTVTSISVGPYPVNSTWDIAIAGDILCDANIEFSGISTCIVFDCLEEMVDFGTPCNDQDPCTVDDAYNTDCDCVGIFADEDGDGVCDNDDMCANFDDTLNGTDCNDDDNCTVGDVYVDCDCVGTFADEDGDGICDNDDDFNDLLIGTECNDQDDCTVNDIYVGSTCMGTFLDTDGDGVCDNDDIDCNGDVNGTADTDECGICAGGETGITPNSSCTDCNGDVNGTADTDECGICAGGETGITPGFTCCETEMQICIPQISTYTICPEFCAGDTYTLSSYDTSYGSCTINNENNCVTYQSFPGDYEDFLVLVGCNETGDCDTLNYTIEVSEDCEDIIEEEPLECNNQDVIVCTAPVTPITLCPEFCLFSGDFNTSTNYSIQEFSSYWTECSLSELPNNCLRFVPLPLFEDFGKPDTVEIIACNTDELCDTIRYLVNVIEDCNEEYGEKPEVNVTNITQVPLLADVNLPDRIVAIDEERTVAIEEERDDEFLSVENIKAYPNPNNGVFNIQLRDNIETEQLLQIYSTKGILITEIEIPAHSAGRIVLTDLSEQPKGIYMIRWRSAFETQWLKVVID